MTFQKWTPLLLLVLVSMLLSSCSQYGNERPEVSSGDSQPRLKLIATTGQIHSALQQITAGTPCELTLLCGPGVDPHSFSASTNDVQSMIDADLIVYNGFYLEAKLSEHLGESFKDKSWAMAGVFPHDDRIEWMDDGKVDPDAPFDPHIWNHLPGWSHCVSALVAHLAEMDSENATTYRTNGEKYVTELNQAHQWAAGKLSQLPEDRRTIISGHDAFGYFARNYGMKTGAPLGIGNDAEADIRTMRELAELICDKRIPAIFVETISNQQVSQALSEACQARGWKVDIVNQPLYSDDLGPDPPVNTFLGAFRSNVNVIYGALSRKE